MNNCVDSNHYYGIEKGDNHPDINPLDVISGWQRVEHINEERGKSH